MQIPVVRNVLEANEKMAGHVRRLLSEKGILALNLISSPGAGKTTLLERTLSDLAGEFRMAVVEGDLQTDNDARRVAATGAQAVQINTDGGMVREVEVMIAAVIVSVGLMMLFARAIGEFVSQHPTIKMLALSFLVVVGVVLLADGFGHHVPKGYIYFAMAFSVIVEMLNIRLRKGTRNPVDLREAYVPEKTPHQG